MVLEFHHKMQGEMSVEQLCIYLQQLGRKAYKGSSWIGC